MQRFCLWKKMRDKINCEKWWLGPFVAAGIFVNVVVLITFAIENRALGDMLITELGGLAYLIMFCIIIARYKKIKQTTLTKRTIGLLVLLCILWFLSTIGAILKWQMAVNG